MKRKTTEEELHSVNMKAQRALKSAIHKTIVERAKSGDNLVIWEDGKVVYVPAKQLLAKEPPAKYGKRKKR